MGGEGGQAAGRAGGEGGQGGGREADEHARGEGRREGEAAKARREQQLTVSQGDDGCVEQHTAVSSEAWAKLRVWTSVAGRGWLLLSGSVAHASLKTAVHRILLQLQADIHNRI